MRPKNVVVPKICIDRRCPEYSALREKTNRYLGSIKTELLRDINGKLLTGAASEFCAGAGKKRLVVIVDDLDRMERSKK